MKVILLSQHNSLVDEAKYWNDDDHKNERIGKQANACQHKNVANIKRVSAVVENAPGDKVFRIFMRYLKKSIRLIPKT